MEIGSVAVHPRSSACAGDSARADDVVAPSAPASMFDALRPLASQGRVPLAITALSCWAALMSRWTGQDLVRLDVRVAGSEELPPSVVKLQADLEDSTTIAALQAQLNRGWIEQGSSSANGFQSASGLVVEHSELRLQLWLHVGSHGGVSAELTGSAQADGGFPTRVMSSFRNLLQGIAADPQGKVSRLSLLTDAERQQVLQGFNATAALLPKDRLIHELVEEQVRRTPNEVAIMCNDDAITFAELNVRANKLARALQWRGVGPYELVAVCVERSVEMVVSLLAVLKAGGAYVPLDPAYPAERLAYMLSDAKPRLVITQHSLRDVLPHGGLDAIHIDDDWSWIAQLDAGNVPRAGTQPCPHQLAYVIYTSGSTGTPKGAVNEHRGMVNRILAQENIEHFSRGEVCGQATSISFVDAVFEIFGALANGCALVIIPVAVVRDVEKLGELIARRKVTRLVTVPSLARLMLDSASVMKNVLALRSWTLSGEEVRADLLMSLQRKLPVCDFIIQYGSSEVSSDAVIFKSRCFSEERVPLGRPLQNVQIYILDRYGEPVPVGVTGEIYVAGVGVGRGYRHRPALTAERFLPNRFSDRAHGRLYRMGDLGRWRGDGMIEYLGRADYQVKIRGFRVELGEIEAQLLRQPGIRQAVVVMREDVPGQKRIVAYVTLLGDSVPDAPALNVEERERTLVQTLRAHIKERVPDYMVPSAFVMLERFPLTPNGKLDRRALPAPSLDAFATSRYEAPISSTEKMLARIWQELLGVERVGRHDHFIEMGGHSLLIAQMLVRLRAAGFTAELRQVFDAPTLAHFAETLVPAGLPQPEAPANLIPANCHRLTPEMLPLVVLRPVHLQNIENEVPGGAQNVQDIYPLSSLQEGILFHHLLNEGGADAYILATLLSVSSRQRLDELVKALQGVIARHDVLRTAIIWAELPQPVQVVARQALLPVREMVLDANRDAREQVRAWSRNVRIDLQRAPLMELRVSQHPKTAEWYALLLIHHIVLDAASLRAVIAETAALLEDSAVRLPEPAPYRDFVAQALLRDRGKLTKDFFSSKLGDVDESTAPFGVLDVHADGGQVREATLECKPYFGERLRVQSRRFNVTAATLFHAAWGLVVARTSGRDDVVFGSVLFATAQGVADGRRALGLFINMLPVRIILESISAMELAVNMQRELIQLMTHEQASLANAQQSSGVIGAPLFTSVLNYRHDAVDFDTEWGRASGIRMLDYQERTNYPILISVDELRSGFTLTAQTVEQLDPAALLRLMNEALRSLVDALEQAPSTPALQLSILPQQDLDQALRVVNETRVASQLDRSIHGLFEEQVAEAPDSTAVEFAGQSLSYTELNGRANKLARYLRRRGVKSGELVGVCVDRSIEMVVGVLAALKAGAAYLPLDPNYPAERLRYMINDSAPRLVLMRRALTGLTDVEGCVAVDIDEALQESTSCADHNLSAHEASVAPDDVVYVIYTSGSTGRPKGTMMEHRSMINLIEWHRAHFSARQRVLQFAALSFDVAFQEIFSTLCTGSALVLLDEWTRRDARALTDFIVGRAIERLFLPPLMLQGLAESWRTNGIAPSGLKDVITAGEQLQITPEVADLFGQLPGCKLHNHYGPTESHVVTALTLSGPASEWPVLPAIGKPLWNTRIYLLDRRQQPVPRGAVGEIYIAGVAVARGYLRRAELTSQRFVADPFSDEGRGRMYRTGDLGRWRDDGSLEYLGRQDEQVKIRGHRVELGEIEARISQHEAVREVAVVVREVAAGDRRLVAYVTKRGDASLTVEQLQSSVRSALPEYMVPSAFVILDNMPLTPSGKLNRRALPAPDQTAYITRHYVPPQGALEQQLAGVWQSVLNVRRVGRDDSFFELGGHSLTAMKLVARLAEQAGVRLPISTVFRCSTLRQMAAAVSSMRNTDSLPTSIDALQLEDGVI